jgi:ribonucleoside-triphosphate reductase
MKLVKKTKIEDKNKYYDINVPVTHNYVLANGAVVHNTGIGYSVQQNHIEQLPPIRGVQKDSRKRYLIGDSIEGWSDAIKALVESYFFGKEEVDFDYRDIRPKGARLITSGGKAPGPEPLRRALTNIKSVFENALQDRGFNTRLKSIEAHDIMCHIADAVLSGGIRRAAMISLFSFDDTEMLEAKFGNWWETNPQRGRANNSVVIDRSRITEDDFWSIWHKVEASNAGEPGIAFSNDPDKYGINPCAEISLLDMGFCNLTEINAATVASQEDFEERVWAATILGTLQAAYTDFHYLRSGWRKNAIKEALLGVSITGIASGALDGLDIKQASLLSKEINAKYAEIIGINKAKRITTIKPSGTTSIILGTSSGVHAWHNDYYLRRIRINKNESLYPYLNTFYPELLENEFFSPETTAIITVPQKAPDGAILRTEDPIDTLNRVKKFHNDWIKPGHRSGKNTHNVSCTISIHPDEFEKVGHWMWKNRDNYTAISVLPYSGGSYKQTPFEDLVDSYILRLANGEIIRGKKAEDTVIVKYNGDEEVEEKTISELANDFEKFKYRGIFGSFEDILSIRYMTKTEQYEELVQSLKEVDVSVVLEEDDNTDLSGEAACSSGGCEIV